MSLRAIVLLGSVFLAGCAVTPPSPPGPPSPSTALRKLSEGQAPLFDDDADTATLRTAALQSVTYYRSRPEGDLYKLGGDTYTAAELADSHRYFVQLIDEIPSRDAWQAAVRRNFQVYQSNGTDSQRTVTFSSYYEPTIPARLKKTKPFRYPLYGRPPDLIDVDLGQFDPVYQGARIAGRRKGQNLVPYPTRGDIDAGGALKGKAPILAWARTPADIFFLQIEGSGWLDLGKGKKARIRFAGTNGRRYQSVGLHMINSGRIPKEQFNHESFAKYLEAHPKERQSYLNINPRYVFFWIDRSTATAFAYGNIEVPLTPGRSVATDPRLFPKGLLGWMETDQPVLDAAGNKTGTRPLKRFILNQDEGGAILGPGRVDYFVGEGDKAHQFATNFWQKGTLYFLVRKKAAP